MSISSSLKKNREKNKKKSNFMQYSYYSIVNYINVKVKK